MSTPTQTPGPEARTDDRLESWKEIAVFLRRDIRTVQRWEKSESMPVHRHVHDKLGSVYAFKSELTKWQQQRSGTEAAAAEVSEPTVATPLSEETPDRPRWWNRALIATAIIAVVVTIAVIRYQRPEAGTAKILVLPFTNLSGDASQEYFSDGITEELITSLGRETDGMQVTALGSSLAYKNSPKPARQIGKELKVDYIVTGTVRRSGEHVRVSAHLVRTRDEAHLWDDSYDREITDILGLQSDIAAAITDGVRLRLGPKRPAPKVNPAAYEAYLKGRFFWNKRSPEGAQEAIQYFQQSIAADESYAPAYVGLGDCYMLLGSAQMSALSPLTAMPKAKEAVNKALQLEPDLAEAHASLGQIKLIFDWDFPGAEAEFRRAIQLNPGYPTAHQWYALYFNATGQTDKALGQLKIAEQLDPLSPVIKVARADTYYLARKYDDSAKAANEALDFNPDYVLAWLMRGRAYEQQHNYQNAFSDFTHAWQLSGGRSPAVAAFIAHNAASAGEKAKAREGVRELEAEAAKPNGPYVSPLYVATVYTGLGDLDLAIEYLNKAAQERNEYMIYLQREPMADALRSDPRFPALLAKYRLK